MTASLLNMKRLTSKLAAGFTVTVTHAQFSSMSASNSRVRVVSYNVLSDSLCEPSHYFKCNPDDLNEEVRLKRVKRQLKQQMEKGAILCLQEVSRNWGSKLIPFFEENGYAYAGGPYGTKFNGYMGVCVAWPREKHAVEEVKVERVVDTVQWREKTDWDCPKCKARCFGSRSHCFKCNTLNPETPPRTESPPTVVATSPLGTLARIAAFIALFSQGLSASQATEMAKPAWDTWAQVAKRQNCAVMVRLRDRESGQKFAVCTYHMPCLFGSDEKCQVMVAHVSMLMKAAQRFAGSDPLVVAGDFNMQPDTPPYLVAVNGSLDKSNPQYPPEPAPITNGWMLNAQPMQSAYRKANG